MSNFFYFSKTLLKAHIAPVSKMIIGVVLSYHNAGFPQNATLDRVSRSLGLSEKRLAHKLNTLCCYLTVEDDVIKLNHKELLKQKILTPDCYRDISSIL